MTDKEYARYLVDLMCDSGLDVCIVCDFCLHGEDAVCPAQKRDGTTDTEICYMGVKRFAEKHSVEAPALSDMACRVVEPVLDENGKLITSLSVDNSGKKGYLNILVKGEITYQGGEIKFSELLPDAISEKKNGD